MTRQDMERIAAAKALSLRFREKQGRREVLVYEQGCLVYLGQEHRLTRLDEADFKARIAQKLTAASEARR